MSRENEPMSMHRNPGLWHRACRLMAMCSVIVMLGMMLLTSTDVVARYAFNHPISGAFELTEIGLALVVFLAMPLTTLSHEHVEVDLLPIPHRSLRRIFVRLLSATAVTGVFGVMAWEVWEHAEKLLARGTVTNSLSVPLYLIGFVIAFACAASALAPIIALFGRGEK